MKNENVKNFFSALLDPNKSPSSTTLICLAAGVIGIIFGIISSILHISDGIDISKYMLLIGAGGKIAQGMVNKGK